MPMFVEGQDPRAPADPTVAPPPLAPPDATDPFAAPSHVQTIESAFRQDNPIASVLSAVANQGAPYAYDPDHNPFADLRGSKYEPFAYRFLGSPNQATTDAIKAQIDREQQDRQTLASSGFAGTVAGVAATALDPSYWLFAEATPFRAGGGLLGKAAEGAFIGGGGAALSEGALQASQQTRAPGESIGAIASNTILGGLLGGAAGFLLPEERAAAAASLDEARAGYRATAPDLIAQATGAAPADIRTLQPKSYGLDKLPVVGSFLNSFSPNARVYFNSMSIAARRALADMAETAIRFTQHDEGVPTSLEGPIESQLRVQKNQYMLAAHDALQEQFIAHRFPNGAPSKMDMLATAANDLRGATPEGKLSYADFKNAVYDAMYSGDQHVIPEVQSAAQAIRREVFDPIQGESQTTIGPDGRPMLAEELQPPKGDQSFVPRAWNRDAIIPRRYEFKQRVSDWLEGEQAEKAATQERIGALNDSLNDAHARIDRLSTQGDEAADELGRETMRAEGLRKQIEQEIADWRGVSGDEARAALKARAEAEAERLKAEAAGEYKGRGDRLTAADSAVDRAVRAILESDRSLSRQEIEARVDEIIDRIIGSPDGRIPYDAPSGGPRIGYTGGAQQVRGSLNARDFAIPTALVKEFVHRDMEHVVASYLRTVLPDLKLTQRFGDVDMTNVFRRINEDYAARVTDKTSERQAKKIAKQRDSDIRDVAAVRDRLRGVYGWSADSRRMAGIVRDVQNWNALTSLGTSVLNRLNDLGAQAVFRYGLANVFHDAWAPFFKSMLNASKVGGVAKREAREAGVGVDGLLGHLRHNLMDISSNYLPGNKFSRGIAWAADRSMLVNLHGPWTDWMKAMAWTPAQAEFGRVAKRIAEGTATKRDLATMADASISPDLATRISAQYEAHHHVVDGVKLANTPEWTDRAARDAFERAMSREANIAVITAGEGDKPLFLSKTFGRMIGQFKSFVAGAHERILISNLQQRDGRTMQGALVSLVLGMMSYRLYTIAAGQEVSENPADWVKEGLHRSALLGWFSEANNALARFSGGVTDFNRLYGGTGPLSRRRDISVLGELLGPTASFAEGVGGLVGHALGGSLSAQDIHQARLRMPLQNLMGFRRGFDDIEDSAASAFGMKPRNREANRAWTQ